MVKFILGFLSIASVDCIFGFSLFLVWKYLDLKYFSSTEIELLKEENKMLKKENRKLGGSSEFWREG